MGFFLKKAVMTTAVGASSVISWGWQTKRIVSFTTSREFDPRRGSSWDVSARKLRDLMEDEYSISPKSLVFAGQVHGNQIKDAGDADTDLLIPDCDGLFTNSAGVFVVIRTADCLPIVLVDETRHQCVALHAGWKGSLANIVSAGVRTMVAHGSEPCDIIGRVAPRISAASYEVSEDLITDFRVAHGHLGNFAEGRHLDLPKLNQLQAADAGMRVDSLEDCGMCTFADSNLFNSHRRQGVERGQQFTVIGLLP